MQPDRELKPTAEDRALVPAPFATLVQEPPVQQPPGYSQVQPQQMSSSRGTPLVTAAMGQPRIVYVLNPQIVRLNSPTLLGNHIYSDQRPIKPVCCGILGSCILDIIFSIPIIILSMINEYAILLSILCIIAALVMIFSFVGICYSCGQGNGCNIKYLKFYKWTRVTISILNILAGVILMISVMVIQSTEDEFLFLDLILLLLGISSLIAGISVLVSFSCYKIDLDKRIQSLKNAQLTNTETQIQAGPVVVIN